MLALHPVCNLLCEDCVILSAYYYIYKMITNVITSTVLHIICHGISCLYIIYRLSFFWIFLRDRWAGITAIAIHVLNNENLSYSASTFYLHNHSKSIRFKKSRHRLSLLWFWNQKQALNIKYAFVLLLFCFCLHKRLPNQLDAFWLALPI